MTDSFFLGHAFPQVSLSGSASAHLGDINFDATPLIPAQRQVQADAQSRRQEEARKVCVQAFKTSNYEQQKDLNPHRAPGTCKWVIADDHFVKWRNWQQNGLLWISADPGCGKSVLSRYLIDFWLQDTATPCVCYYFFKDNDEQSGLSKALCAVLHQLFEQEPHLIDNHAMPSWYSVGAQLANETKRLWQILRSTTVDRACLPIICVLDGLDECRDEDRKDLIKFLCDVYAEGMAPAARTANWRSRLKLLVASRPYDNVQRWFQDTIERFPQIRLRGEEKNDSINSEINIVIKSRVRDLARKFDLTLECSDRLETQLLHMKHRTYLWLHLALEDIRTAFHKSVTPEDVDVSLVPVSIEDAYESILGKIDAQQKPVVRTI